MNDMFTLVSAHVHIRDFTNHLRALLLPVLAYSLLAGLTLGAVETAQAQPDTESNMPKVVDENATTPVNNAFEVTSALWRVHFGDYAADVLRGAGPDAKREVMLDLIVVARNDNGRTDLSATLSPLLEIVKNGASSEHRLLALQAIHLIGTEHSMASRYRRAMEKLYRIAHEISSDNVRRGAADVLMDYYGGKEKN